MDTESVAVVTTASTTEEVKAVVRDEVPREIPEVGKAIELVLIQGDLSKLSSEERVKYYNAVCNSLALNPLTKPFDYLTFQGKSVLYAKKDCTDQLRFQHNVSTEFTDRKLHGEIYVVTCRATLPSGRHEESTGAVSIGGLKGDALANAYMKAETKAKRRATLSVCGLSMLDETEVETIPNSVVGERAVQAAPRQLTATSNRRTEEIGERKVTKEDAQLFEEVREASNWPPDKVVTAMNEKFGVGRLSQLTYPQLEELTQHVANNPVEKESLPANF